MTRVVPGHGLMAEGAAYDGQGNRRPPYSGIGGQGHAKCSCGQVSEQSFSSGGQRQRWHRDHKDEVLARGQGD